MRSINPGRYLIFFLIKFPVELRQNHVWGPIFEPSYDYIYKCDYFDYTDGRTVGALSASSDDLAPEIPNDTERTIISILFNRDR